MEIVIKIDDSTYKDIMDNGIVFDEDNSYVATAIKNGTPLPKGHGTLKDTGKLSYECMHEKSSECNHLMCDTCQFNCVAKYEIEDTPTIIEADGNK